NQPRSIECVACFTGMLQQQYLRPTGKPGNQRTKTMAQRTLAIRALRTGHGSFLGNTLGVAQPTSNWSHIGRICALHARPYSLHRPAPVVRPADEEQNQISVARTCSS